MTYYWVINGTTNTTTVDSNSTFNASDGYYNLTVKVSDGLQNGSASVLFRLDATPPTYSNLANNGSTVTRINGTVNWSVTLADNAGISGYRFAHNNTGTLTNGSFIAGNYKLLRHRRFNWYYSFATRI